MSVEDFASRVEEIRARREQKQENPTSTLNEDEALEMGILQPEETETNQDIQQPIDNNNNNIETNSDYLEGEEEERQYEKLGFWESQGDALKSVGVEALHFFQPQSMETQYESKTHYGENMKYLYRYGVGTAAFIASLFYGGGEVRAAGAAISAVPKLSRLGGAVAKLGTGLQKLNQTGKIVNSTKWGLQAARQGKNAKAAIMAGNVINGAFDGLVAGALADFTLYRPSENEGHLADAFGDTDNKLISFLQTNPDDTALEGRLKNVVDGLILSPILGGAIGGFAPVLKKPVNNFLKGLHGTLHAKTAEEASEALIQTAQSKIALDNVATTLDLEQQVESLIKESQETGEEVSQLIIDRMPTTKIEEARAMAQLKMNGEEIFPYEDGTWSIRITNYEDAYKVTPEQYKAQLLAQDETGNLGISHMNRAVEDTWRQRGLIDGDGLLGKTKERTNTTKAIVDYYNNKWDFGKNKITVKYGDWSNIPDGKTTQYKNGNVLIQINNNSKDVYATLRSELEHARDFVKGEVPDQNLQHFSRYNGINEAEAAPDYVYKKSVGRAKALNPEDSSLQNVMKDGQTPPEEVKYNQGEINGQQGTNTNTNTTGSSKEEVIRRFVEGAARYNDSGSYENGLFVQRDNLWVVNEGKTQLFDDASVSKANYKELPQNVESGQQFADALSNAKKNLGASGENVDVHTAEEYANAKTFLSEDGLSGVAVTQDGEIISVFVDPTAKVSEGRGRGRALIELAKQNGGTHLNCYDVGLPNFYKQHGFVETNRMKWSDEYWDKDKWHKELHTEYNNGEPDVIEMKLENTAKVSEPQQPTQLKLDFNTTPTDIGTSIANGDVRLNQEGNIDSLVNHIINTDPEISGKTFKDVVNDADSYFNQAVKDNPQEAAAYFNAQSPEVIDGIVRQQLAATKLISILKDVQANANPRENLRILSAVKSLDNYIHEVGSQLGRGLRYQSITKKAMDTFGTERFSDLALQGINDIADILDNVSLNFTRNQTLKQFKTEVLTQFKQHPAYNEIVGDRNLFAKLNDVLDEKYKNLKNGKTIDSAELVMETMVKDEAELCGWYAKLCDNTKSFVDTVKHWGNQAPSYVINNVLGVASAFKNISSGIIQTNLYPTYKILGGFLTGNGEIAREGIDQWLGTFVNFGEAMRLAKQAFLNGDGLLTNTKEIVEGSLQNGFNKWATSFKEIGDDGFGITLQNIHSIIPRFMMASDEFMSQLNYRNIVRSKALSQARREANILGDAAQTADEIFRKKAFTEDGKPLDFEAYTEAKDMLFQIPLDRKMFNPATGEKQDTGIDKTLLSGIGSWMQQGTQKFVPLRIFMPFIKTPANIADQALKANPLYAALNPTTRAKFFSNNPEVRAKAVGQMATMLTLGGGFCFAAANGTITGSPPIDKKEKTALLKTGWKPYSIKIGDKWVSYQGMITPLDSYMAFCADTVALAGKALSPEQEMGLNDIAGQIIGSIFNDYIDQSGFRTNTAKLMDIVNPSTDVRVREQLAANVFSGFLPWSSNVGTVKDTVKTIKGDTAQTKPEGFYQNLVRNYIDVFSSTQDYKRDVFGNRVDQYGLIIAKATDDKFMQPEYAEMERLAQKGYTPANIAHLLKKTGVPLEEFKSTETGRSAYDAMYDELTEVKIGGKTLEEAVAALIETPRYQSLNDGINSDGEDWSAVNYKTKKKLLDDTFHRYYNVAKRNVINKRGDEFIDKDGYTMKEKQKQIKLQMINERVKDNLDQNLINKITKF